MTAVAVPGGLWLPAPWLNAYNAPEYDSAYNMVLDAAGEKASCIFQIPKSGTITNIGFMTGAVTSSQTLKVGVYSLDASDDPSTTVYGGMAAGTQASPAADTWYEVALGTNATATAGDVVAVTIEWNATAGNLEIRQMAGNSGGIAQVGLPFNTHYTAAWSKQTTTIPCIAIKYDDGSYAEIPLTLPVTAITQRYFSSGSTPDERGMKFTLPAPMRLTKFWLYQRISDVADWDFVLYDSGNSVLLTQTLNHSVGATGRLKVFELSTKQSLTASSVYRAVIKPTTATSDFYIHDMTLNSVAMLDIFGGGQNFHATERTDAGAWTDTTTSRPLMGFVFDQVDDGTGGGGGGGGPLIGGRLVL